MGLGEESSGLSEGIKMGQALRSENLELPPSSSA